MKLIAMVFLALAIFCAHGCHKSGGGGGSGEAAAPDAATTDPSATKADTAATVDTSASDVDNGKPTLAIVGKGNLNLAGDPVPVDGIFLGHIDFSAVTFNATLANAVTAIVTAIAADKATQDQAAADEKAWKDAAAAASTNDPKATKLLLSDSKPLWDGISIGSASPLINGDKPVCQIGMLKKDEAVNVTFCNGLGGPWVPQVSQTAIDAGTFSIDFLVLTVTGIGVVSNGVAYVGALNADAAGAHTNNVDVSDLPLRTVTNADSSILLIYARNDWFPNAFNATVDSAGNITSSITLNANQNALIKHFVTGQGIAVNFVPMPLSVLDVSKATVDPNMVQGPMSAGNGAPSELNNNYPSCPTGSNGIGKGYGEMFTCGTVVSSGWCAYSDSSSTSKCTVNATALALTDTSIPFGKSKFVMEINLDEVLTSDSTLTGDASTLKFNRVNGVPFGTSMAVEEKAATK